MKKKSKKRLLIIVGFVALVLIVAGYFLLFGNKKQQYKTEEVSVGEVTKEVSETGTVNLSDRTDLSFEYAGKIDKIYVKIGDKVSQNDKLAKVDTDQLYIQLADANAALAVAQANYDNLLAGSSVEEIQIAKTDVDNAQVSLDTKNQSLIDVQTNAAEDLQQAYEDAVDYLDSAYLKLYNASKDMDNIQSTYFGGTDQPSLNVKESRDILRDGVADTQIYIVQAKENYDKDKIDAALLKMKEMLSKAKDALAVARNMAEEPDYKNVVSSANKTIIDNDKSYINTVYTNIVSASQTIATTKITNETNTNTAQAAVLAAQVALQRAKDQLALEQAGPTQENIDLYSARVKQAEAQVLLLNNKIQKSVLKSPGSGQIVNIEKRVGEVVQPTEPVMQFLPEGNFEVKVDIYEEDIVYVKVGDAVRISIPAFPNDTLKGRVFSIDPAEKIISGVVYYEVTINLLDQREGIKTGMTADIVIEAEKKENALRVPRGAVKKNNNNKVVKVLKGNNVEERQIEVGLEGDDYVEVISGVSEGEQVIIG
jgi:HlyD family secretion protein